MHARLARAVAIATDPTLPRFKRVKAARGASSIAVKLGILREKKACERCFRKDAPLQKHHPDHGQPLLIRWLCRECHIFEDSL